MTDETRRASVLYPGMRWAFLPMMVTGQIAGASAPVDGWWPLWGLLIGMGVWVVWVLGTVALVAWEKTRSHG